MSNGHLKYLIDLWGYWLAGRAVGVAVHLYMSPMPVVLCTEVLKDV